MIENIELNLERDRLEGWEPFYDSLNVEVLRIAKKCGSRFPPVNIVREDGVYRLVFGMGPEEEWGNYGGHSRSVLAFQDKSVLPCRILPAHYLSPKYEPGQDHPSLDVYYRPISEIKPQRIFTADSLFRLNENLQRIPAELRERFLKQNSLVILDNGVLIDREALRNPPPF